MTTHSKRLAAPAGLLALLFAAGCGNWGFAPPELSWPSLDASAPPPLVGDVSAVTIDDWVSGTFALDDAALFWADTSGVYSGAVRSRAAGSGVTGALYLATPDATAVIEDMAIDPTNVYVAALTSVAAGTVTNLEALPRDGSPPVVLTTTSATIRSVAVATGYLYYSDGASLFRVATTGGATETVQGTGSGNLSLEQVVGLGSQGGVVYWTYRGGAGDAGVDSGVGLLDPTDYGAGRQMLQLTSATATPAEVVTVPGTNDPFFAANDTTLFWITTPSEFTAFGSSESFVIYAPIGGGAPKQLATVPGGVVGLVADDTNVYVMLGGSLATERQVLEVAIDGGATITLASGITFSGLQNTSHQLVVDDANVYFADHDGVESVPK